MRITFVLSHADLSGGVRVVAIYADRLRKRGHDVVVVSRPKRKPTLRERLRSWVRGGQLPSDARPSASYFDGTDIDHRVIDAPRPIEARDVPDADVIIATWWETAEWISRFPSSKGAKAYFLQHHEVHAGLPLERVEATWRLPMQKIVIAKWLADLAKHRFGDKSVLLVPNSVDTRQFNAPARDKQPIPTIGMMYSPVPFKGCDISLKAFDLARQQIPELKLVAFGSSNPAPPLSVPPDTDFVLQPAQEAIRDIYARCDAWLFASRSEGFGLPLLEAMACRTPVIATPAGAAPELVAEGGGVLVHPEHAESMAHAIVELAKMPSDQWRQMSDKAYATANRYTWEDATDKFEAALLVAVEKPRNGGRMSVAGDARPSV
jgi:glycosyltransferase involved in cell wall biosynthesis